MIAPATFARQSQTPPCNTGSIPPSQPPIAVSATLDWVKLTGPSANAKSNLEVLKHYFPDLERASKPRRFYTGEAWVHPENGNLRMDTLHNTSDKWILELPGFACSTLGFTGMNCLLMDIDHPVKCTRLDCAIDLEDLNGSLATLIDDFEADCDSERVFPHRSHHSIRPKDGKRLTGATVYHGDPRSKSLRKLLRLYDKGLESTKGQGKAGQWLRWEASYLRDSAHSQFIEYLATPTRETIRSLAAGIVEDITGPSSWVLPLISTAPLSTTTPRTTADYDSWVRWLRDNVAPRVQAVADIAGVDPLDLLADLGIFDDLVPSRQVLKHPVIAQAKTIHQSYADVLPS
jgi:DNA relaxase NicK